MTNNEQSGSEARTKKNPTNYWRPFMEVIGRGKPSYMIRLHLTPFKWWKWRRVYLHILGRPDADREYHDHPWGFWTIILFGGYTEKAHVLRSEGTPTGNYKIDVLNWLSVRYRPATHAHLIKTLHTRRVISLVLRDNKKARDWGFWVQQDDMPHSSTGWNWVPWKQYNGHGKL